MYFQFNSNTHFFYAGAFAWCGSVLKGAERNDKKYLLQPIRWRAAFKNAITRYLFVQTQQLKLKKETSFILLPFHTEEHYKSSQCAPISTAQTKKYYCNIASKAYSCILFSLVTLIFPASYLAPADRHLTAELQVCSKQAEPTAISLNSSLKDVILCFSLLATYSITVFILKRAKVDY